MSIIAMLKSAFDAIAEYFGYARQREIDKNAPDIKAAAKNAQEQAAVDHDNQIIATKDADATRKELSE